MSTCKLILAITVGVYLGIMLRNITSEIFRITTDKAYRAKLYASSQKQKERDQANKTGRVIGFRPIEQEERA